MLVALFGITNDGLNLFVNLLVLFLVVVWIALIAWTYLDARRRIEDPVLVACATGASLFPFVGTIVYSILRPPEFLEDAPRARARDPRRRAARQAAEEQSCPNCGHPIERSYLRCPNCRARVKDPCESCEKPIDPRWTICPYCETPQRARRRQPRRRAERSRAARRDAERDARRPRAAARSARPAAASAPPARAEPAAALRAPRAPAAAAGLGERRPRPRAPQRAQGRRPSRSRDQLAVRPGRTPARTAPGPAHRVLSRGRRASRTGSLPPSWLT